MKVIFTSRVVGAKSRRLTFNTREIGVFIESQSLPLDQTLPEINGKISDRQRLDDTELFCKQVKRIKIKSFVLRSFKKPLASIFISQYAELQQIFIGITVTKKNLLRRTGIF